MLAVDVAYWSSPLSYVAHLIFPTKWITDEQLLFHATLCTFFDTLIDEAFEIPLESP